MLQRIGHSAQHHGAVPWQGLAVAIQPNFFAISFGLGGLAGVWRLAATLFALPMPIGNVLYLIAAVLFLAFLAAWVTKLIVKSQAVAQDLQNPLLSPFHVLVPLSGLLLALGLGPYEPVAARLLFFFFWIMMLLFGGWIIGQWAIKTMELSAFHPGYFLPIVAGGLVSADVAAHLGLIGLAWANFGLGVIGWFVFGPIIMGRLFFQPALPEPLRPTLAIWVAPPVLAGNAYFTLTQGFLTLPSLFFAGFAVLMVLVQVRLLPWYHQLSFTPGFWSFTFSYATTALYALHWLALVHGAWAAPLGYLILAAITIFIGAIGLRSLAALQHAVEALP